MTFKWERSIGQVHVTEVRCKNCREQILDEYGLPTGGCKLVSGKVKYAEPPTITGLSVWLECEKETIKNYTERDQFSVPLKKAYLRVQKALELKLHDPVTPAAKVIFGLSNFDGWVNKQFTDNKHAGLDIASLIKAQQTTTDAA